MALNTGSHNTRHWPLSRKILGLAVLNLILVAAVLAVFAQWQFGSSIESVLLGPARDRIVAIANSIGRDLDATPYTQRIEPLGAYSRRYGVDFYLVDPRGQSLTGTQIELPRALLDRMRRGARPGGNRRGPGDQGPEMPENEKKGSDKGVRRLSQAAGGLAVVAAVSGRRLARQRSWYFSR